LGSVRRYNKFPAIITIFVKLKDKAMALKLSFFKTPKHRVFNYRPLYWDKEKEELQQRVAKAQEERDRELESAGQRESSKEREGRYIPGKEIRMNFRRNLYESKRRPNSPFFMRIIILLSLLGLMVALYYIAQAFGLFFA